MNGRDRPVMERAGYIATEQEMARGSFKAEFGCSRTGVR